MSFRDESIEAFDAMLEVMQEASPDACVFRCPVTKAGADATGAADYDTIPSPAPDRLELMSGGFLADFEYSMASRVDDFTTLPVAGTLFKRNGKISRILYLDTSELSGVVVFHCGTPNK